MNERTTQQIYRRLPHISLNTYCGAVLLADDDDDDVVVIVVVAVLFACYCFRELLFMYVILFLLWNWLFSRRRWNNTEDSNNHSKRHIKTEMNMRQQLK